MPSVQDDAGGDGEEEDHGGSDKANSAKATGTFLEERSYPESQQANRQIDKPALDHTQRDKA
jgi:hypothetical protein